MNVRTMVTPKGEELVLLSREDYEELVDAREHARAMTAHARGDDPGVPETEMDDYLAAPTPLAFWRRKRGLTQAALAAASNISQPYLAQLETGRRGSADVGIYARLARKLGLRIEDLLDSDD
jgi:DNA-binding XRE family transcriptional regulator